MDKAGEKVTPKNCYTNPSRSYISMYRALGCYLSIYQNKLKRDSDKLFHAKGKDRSASISFSKAAHALVSGAIERQKIVLAHCCEGHFHPDGIRKGSGTRVTAFTMDPPPIPSVLMRGEWKGKC
jgi:hypothetical protein